MTQRTRRDRVAGPLLSATFSQLRLGCGRQDMQQQPIRHLQYSLALTTVRRQSDYRTLPNLRHPIVRPTPLQPRKQKQQQQQQHQQQQQQQQPPSQQSITRLLQPTIASKSRSRAQILTPRLSVAQPPEPLHQQHHHHQHDLHSHTFRTATTGNRTEYARNPDNFNSEASFSFSSSSSSSSSSADDDADWNHGYLTAEEANHVSIWLQQVHRAYRQAGFVATAAVD